MAAAAKRPNTPTLCSVRDGGEGLYMAALEKFRFLGGNQMDHGRRAISTVSPGRSSHAREIRIHGRAVCGVGQVSLPGVVCRNRRRAHGRVSSDDWRLKMAANADQEIRTGNPPCPLPAGVMVRDSGVRAYKPAAYP